MSLQTDELGLEILTMLRSKPVFYYDLLNEFPERSYREIMLAWSLVREGHRLSRDEEGRYYLEEGHE